MLSHRVMMDSSFQLCHVLYGTEVQQVQAAAAAAPSAVNGAAPGSVTVATNMHQQRKAAYPVPPPATELWEHDISSSSAQAGSSASSSDAKAAAAANANAHQWSPQDLTKLIAFHAQSNDWERSESVSP